MRDFYQTYYVPENATVVRRRRFRHGAGARSWPTQYFGRVPKAAHPVPRDIPKEPPQTAERRVTVRAAWPLPAVVVAYHITYDGHPDSYPLHIASKVLSDGQTLADSAIARLRQADCGRAFGGANLIEDPNLFYAVAIVQPGHTPEEAANALIAELDRLKAEPISDHELQRTKNQFARDYILERESNQQKALQLAHAVVIHHDIKTADGEFEIFQNITAADVQRVARTYFTPENRLVSDDSAVGRRPAAGRTMKIACCSSVAVVAVARRRSAARRRRRLAVGSARRGRCRPATSTFRPMRSGRSTTDCRSSPCCTTSSRSSACGMIVRAGAALDPRGKAGLADLAASLLDQGTTTRIGRTR